MAVFLLEGYIWAGPTGGPKMTLSKGLAPSRCEGLSLLQVTYPYSPQTGCDAVSLPFASCLELDQPSRPILTSHARARDAKWQDSLKCSGSFSKDMQSARVLWAVALAEA